MNDSKIKQDLKSPWLLGIIGSIIIVVLVNVTLIVLSYRQPHSLVAKDYYNKGKEYFRTQVNHEDRAARLGYKLSLVIPEGLKVNEEIFVRLNVLDQKNISRERAALENATLFAYRADDNTKDFQLELSRSEHTIEEFSSRVKFSQPGTWDLIGQVIIAGEKIDVAKRIFVNK